MTSASKQKKPLPKIKSKDNMSNNYSDECAQEKYQMMKERKLAETKSASLKKSPTKLSAGGKGSVQDDLNSSFDEDNKSNDKSKNDESDHDEQEDPKDYCKGGYHHVSIGDFYNDRYKVLRKVGWGHFSTVWLSWDTKKARYVALKVVKSAKHYTETALDEIKLLRAVRETDPSDPYRLKTVQLYDDFKIHGPNGTHVCMVFEVLGNNLLKLITKSNYHGIPIENVRIIIKQCLEGLDYLNRKCKIIHTDIKPENILLCVDEQHVKDLADEALHWITNGIKPSESAVSAMIPKASVPAKMSKNKKKKLKQKEKRKAMNNMQKSDDENDQNSDTGINKYNDSPRQNTSGMDIDGSLTLKKENETTRKSMNSSKSRHDSSNDRLSDNEKASVENRSKSGEPRKPVQPPVKSAVNDVLTESELQVKIADLGNACWTNHHFTEDIQTRQYRSLEVIIGAKYDTSADIWSLACMAFELATGDYLFEPHSGENYTRDEDHIAHIIELLGNIPKGIALSGNFSREFFNKRGELLHIGNLKPWDLYSVLTQKYSWNSKDAREFAEFLTPMLDFNTQRRASAHQCLQHKWIQTSRISQSNASNQKTNNNSKQNSPFATSTSSADNSDTSKRDDSSSSASEKMLSQSSVEQAIPMTKPRYYSESIISSHVYDYDSDKRREVRVEASANKPHRHSEHDIHAKKREKSSRKSVDIYEDRGQHHSHRH